MLKKREGCPGDIFFCRTGGGAFLLLAWGAAESTLGPCGSWTEPRGTSEQLLLVFFLDLLAWLLPNRRVACGGAGEQQRGSAASHQT